MPRVVPICQECSTFSLRCTKTTPTAYVGHELESPRVSLWVCKACGARYQLQTPKSTLTLLQHGKPSDYICKKVLDFLGISAKTP